MRESSTLLDDKKMYHNPHLKQCGLRYRSSDGSSRSRTVERSHAQSAGSAVMNHTALRSIWSRRTPLEKGLILLCISFLLFSIATLLITTVPKKSQSFRVKANSTNPCQLHEALPMIDKIICLQEEYKKVALTMLGEMNKAIDPCEDFYQVSSYH